MERGHENEINILKNRIDELEKQHKNLKEFHHDMVDKLKDKIECPVCMEIPRKGPVPVCPNGHFVCPKCKKESCPTCRSNMGSNKSVLAGTIIDSIEHKCKFDDCDQSFLLTDLDKHEETCQHRSVCCPSCTIEISLSKLRSHLLDETSCDEGNTFVHLNKNRYFSSFRVDGDLMEPDMEWGVNMFSVENMDFVVYPEKSQGNFYFVIVMLGTEAQCSQYRVKLHVHEYTSKRSVGAKSISFKFCGNPTSIDADPSELDSLRISETSMKRVLDKSWDKTQSFCVSYSIAKEK